MPRDDASPRDDLGRSMPMELELTLAPADAGRLARLHDLGRPRGGRSRATVMRQLWHDTPTAALAADGLALCEATLGRETQWRLARMHGAPGMPPALVTEAPASAGLGVDLPGPLLPVAACEGTLRVLAPGAAESAPRVTLLEGVLRAVTGEQPVCRVMIAGSPGEVTGLALALAAQVRLYVPAASLAAEAYATAGRVVAPAAIGAPSLPTGASVGDAFASIAAHLTGVLLHWAPVASADGGPEPVHQMRVALRRLRSAIALFRRALAGPALDTADGELRALMRVLGPARDWDVFAAGPGRAVAEAFPDDRAVQRLMAAAERRRVDSYAALDAFLNGPAFRALGIRLASLVASRPWEQPPAEVPADDPALRDAADKQAAAMAASLRDFADHALSRRLARVNDAGDDLSPLPAEALHGIRIQAKRLRYAAEFFAPLYPPRETRRFIRRVAAMQDRLGQLNDGVVVQHLMAQLGAAGERGYAAGVVRGFVAAGLRNTRAKAERSWRKFRRLEPFWS